MKRKLATAGIAALSLVVGSLAASAETKVIRFAHDSNGDILDNPNHACASVFASIVNTSALKRKAGLLNT